jgi:hypothetical protein
MYCSDDVLTDTSLLVQPIEAEQPQLDKCYACMYLLCTFHTITHTHQFFQMHGCVTDAENTRRAPVSMAHVCVTTARPPAHPLQSRAGPDHAANCQRLEKNPSPPL